MAKGTATRNTILARAIDLTSVHGLDGVSIAQLADDLELSKSGLFAHFKSKEALQLAVLEASAEKFTAVVVKPSVAEPRGEPRVRAIFERWLAWASPEFGPKGGCVFVAASIEFDDQPGPVRDLVVKLQNDWINFVANNAKMAVEAGHFRANLDGRRFAQELYGILLSHYLFTRLLRDQESEARTRSAFEHLIGRSRAL